MSDERKDLPGADAPNFQQRAREVLQTYLGRQGNPLDRGLTLRDLLGSGIGALRDGFTLRPGAGSLPLVPGGAIVTHTPDLTPPPQPSGVVVTPGISFILIEHDAPTYTVGNGHLRTRLYGAKRASGGPVPVFGDAVEVAQFDGAVYAFASDPSITWHFWLKWESADNVLSATPAGGTNGYVAVTGQDVTNMVTAMTGTGKPFTVLASPQTIDGVTFPAGIYSTNAFLMDAQITTAKIKDLAVTDAKINSLSVDKLTAGSIAVGRYIQSSNYVANTSGWKIDGAGNAEFQNVKVRGDVQATSLNGTGIVDTTALSANAVTERSYSVYGSPGAVFIVSSTPSNAVSSSIATLSGTKIIITISTVGMLFNQNAVTSGFSIYYEIVKDGSTVLFYGYSHEIFNRVAPGYVTQSVPFSATVQDMAVDGSSHTYSCRLSFIGTKESGATVGALQPVISVLAVKR
jgi:hypothetical protein